MVTTLWIIERKYYKRRRHWGPADEPPYRNRFIAIDAARKLAGENIGWQYRVAEFTRGSAA